MPTTTNTTKEKGDSTPAETSYRKIEWRDFQDDFTHVLQVKPSDLREDKDGPTYFIVGGTNGRPDLLVKALLKIVNHPLASNDKIILMGNWLGTFTHTYVTLNLMKALKSHFKDMFIPLIGFREQALLKMTPEFFTSTRLGRSIVGEYLTRKRSQFLEDDVEWLAENLRYFVETEDMFISTGFPKVDYCLSNQRVTHLTRPTSKYFKEFDSRSRNDLYKNFFAFKEDAKRFFVHQDSEVSKLTLKSGRTAVPIPRTRCENRLFVAAYQEHKDFKKRSFTPLSVESYVNWSIKESA